MNTDFQFINLSYLELMADGDTDMKLTMLEMLLDEVPAEMEKMEALIQDENWEELKGVSHKMKSTLSFIGNDRLTHANQQVEDIAKSEKGTERLPELIATLLDLYPKAVEELKMAAAAI